MENLLHTINKCVEQDRIYHRKFYERYFGFAVKIAFRYVTDYDIAKEIVHDSFIKVFNNLRHFLEKTETANNVEFSLMGWMRKIIINTSIDRLRRNNAIPKLVEINEDIWDDNADSISADDNLLYKELLIELSKLPPTYRVVFNLHAVEGYTHKEIAGMLGITTGGTKAIYFKAKGLLQKNLVKILDNKPLYAKS